MRLFLLSLMTTAILALPAAAGTYPLAVGAYSGYDVPALQQDIGSGMMWGVGVRGNIWRFVHGQLIVRGTSQGDVEQEVPFGNNEKETITYRGGTLTGFGLNVLIAKKNPCSIWPYALLGFSSNSFNFGGGFKDDQSLMGWSLGGGLGVSLYQKKIYLDAQTYALISPFHDNNASRKNWQTLIGVQYFIPIRTK